MRFIVTISALLLMAAAANAQKASIENSSWGVQAGFLGIWGHTELRVSNSVAMRGELGFDSGIWGGSFYDETVFIMTPVITVEPRWYYNLEKRAKNLKNTANNSGSFLTLQASFHPNWFVISNYGNIKIISDISIIPTWGARRTLGKHFCYELGVGLGYRYIFAKNAGYLENEVRAAINLHLRIGYSF